MTQPHLLFNQQQQQALEDPPQQDLDLLALLRDMIMEEFWSFQTYSMKHRGLEISLMTIEFHGEETPA